ncbi:MAG: aspartate aminotransferase family protein [Alphaproteobacteria bacterium]|nr:aspartate aminotransferase family protein [Alphaproteobacteria bacterium]
MRFPENSRPRAEVLAQLKGLKSGDADWKKGRVPLYVFKATTEAAEVGQEAFNEYFTENALGGKRAFSSLKRMEDEVAAMALDLFHAPEGAVGNMTTGGSESILMAVKAARDFARKQRCDKAHRGNLVLPASAHPAFNKAALLMDLEVRRVPVTKEFLADPAAMAAACDRDTIMIVGSAPCFPYGAIDPIRALGAVAGSKNLWLHVDACVGGYVAPFVRDEGYPIPDFDFAVPEVSSLSADLHKFGFAPKPASTVFYRDAEKRAGQTFSIDEWPNGRFVTETLTGTRAGGAVAAAWALMQTLGRSGYRKIARELMTMRDAYIDGISAIPGFRVFGKPHLTLLGFGAADLDMGRVAEGMAKRGWVPGMLKDPPGLHLMMSLLHADARSDYLRDLAASAAEVRTSTGKAKIEAVY